MSRYRLKEYVFPGDRVYAEFMDTFTLGTVQKIFLDKESNFIHTVKFDNGEIRDRYRVYEPEKY
jgi:hypothetical protein